MLEIDALEAALDKIVEPLMVQRDMRPWPQRLNPNTNMMVRRMVYSRGLEIYKDSMGSLWLQSKWMCPYTKYIKKGEVSLLQPGFSNTVDLSDGWGVW